MGKGDKRTRRGKITAGSFGNKRPHRAKKVAGEAAKADAGVGKGKKK
jgi:30S ribosomal protein S31